MARLTKAQQAAAEEAKKTKAAERAKAETHRTGFGQIKRSPIYPDSNLKSSCKLRMAYQEPVEAITTRQHRFQHFERLARKAEKAGRSSLTKAS
jgi:hypothetical protein